MDGGFNAGKIRSVEGSVDDDRVDAEEVSKEPTEQPGGPP
jgi:hypothetical protein